MATLAVRHGLPSALLQRLSPEALQTIAETAREQRFKILASQLNLTEAALLAALASATGLAVLDEPAVDSQGTKILPARLAAEAQVIPVLLPGAKEGRLALVSPLPPDLETADWVATFTDQRPQWFLAAPERVAQLITENYGVGGGSLDDEGSDLPELQNAQADVEADADATAITRVATTTATNRFTQRSDARQVAFIHAQ